MGVFARLISAIVLLGVTGFCVFGFLATFEPLPAATQWTWRAIYGIVGTAALVGAAMSRRDLRDGGEGSES